MNTYSNWQGFVDRYIWIYYYLGQSRTGAPSLYCSLITTDKTITLQTRIVSAVVNWTECICVGRTPRHATPLMSNSEIEFYEWANERRWWLRCGGYDNQIKYHCQVRQIFSWIRFGNDMWTLQTIRNLLSFQPSVPPRCSTCYAR